MEEYRFGVVIVTYNRLQLLKECINNILNQKRQFDLITIIDNKSTDGTKDYLDSITGSFSSKINVVHCRENLGGSGGFKRGVDKSYRYVDYILLIDDDAMLCENFLTDIEQHIDPSVYAYSGPVLTDGKVDTTHRKRVKNGVLMSYNCVPLEEYNSEYFDYDLSTFCGLMISTKIVSQIGLPKSEYFIWYDDSEYSLRLLKYTRIRNINSALINHKTKLSYTDKLSWKSYYGYRNKIDMGTIYSKCPLVFKSYRILYHIIRCIQYYVMSIFTKGDEHKYYIFAYQLMQDVIRDSLHGSLGINNKYLPR